MIKILHFSNPQEREKILQILRRQIIPGEGYSAEPAPERAQELVAEILLAVKTRGDEALLEYTSRFDGIKLTPELLSVSPAEIATARRKVKSAILGSLQLIYQRLVDFHRQEQISSWMKIEEGAWLGQICLPLERVGFYVPGGTAPLVSSLMMMAAPARVAGVKEIALCTPPGPRGKINPYLLTIADILGIKEIYRIGGAQAIAALAYGTRTIPRVSKIVGPGNIYVALAKKMVFGEVDIESIAGPSEILIVADDNADPAWVAADLLAQAEHGEDTYSILITPSRELAWKVEKEILPQLANLSRKAIIEQSLKRYGAIIISRSLDEAIEGANLFAPEHLVLMIKDSLNVLVKIRNAGTIFLGNFSPVAVGDYVAGPNHILPTGGTARFFSPLGVKDFVKNSNVIFCTSVALKKMASILDAVAGIEGLDAHQKSVHLRLDYGTKKGRKRG